MFVQKNVREKSSDNSDNNNKNLSTELNIVTWCSLETNHLARLKISTFLGNSILCLSLM